MMSTEGDIIQSGKYLTNIIMNKPPKSFDLEIFKPVYSLLVKHCEEMGFNKKNINRTWALMDSNSKERNHMYQVINGSENGKITSYLSYGFWLISVNIKYVWITVKLNKPIKIIDNKLQNPPIPTSFNSSAVVSVTFSLKDKPNKTYKI